MTRFSLVLCLLACGAVPTAGRAQPAARADDARACATQNGAAAIGACTRAIASRRFIRSDLALLHYRRAMLLRDANEFDGAIADFGVAIHLNGDAIPMSADAFDVRMVQRNAYLFRGLTFEDKRDYDRALADYEALLAADPRDMRALSRQAGIFAKKGDCGRAVAAYDAVIATDPNAWEGLIGRARCHAMSGHRDAAIADYRAALSGEIPDAAKTKITSELQQLMGAP